jgi:hypothetical protein
MSNKVPETSSFSSHTRIISNKHVAHSTWKFHNIRVKQYSVAGSLMTWRNIYDTHAAVTIAASIKLALEIKKQTAKSLTYALQARPKVSLKPSTKIFHVSDRTDKNVPTIFSRSLHLHNRRV